MGAPTLIALARQVRSRTVMILERADVSWLTWAPEGTANHILWHAGHAVWVQDVLCVEPLTGRSELPEGWARLFGMQSFPGAHVGTWPTREEVLAALRAQLPRMEAMLTAADPAKLGALATHDDCGWGIVHGLHDEACHVGEMYLLFKLCRAGKGPTAQGASSR